jgi:MGT family glycosyltransferase
LFLGIVPAALQDLEAELSRESADVLVGDSASVMTALLHERTGVPVAVFGITVLAMPSRDTAPFGLALMPSASRIGRMRNVALNWLVDHVVFRKVNRRFHQLRRELGLPPFPGSLFELPRISALFLQGSAASFEYPRSDLMPQVRFVGATLPEASPEWSPPDWWEAMNGRPVVLLTQGTINNDFDQLIRPAMRALADEDVTVVVTTGNRPSAEAAIDPLPANVRIERFIPYRHLMPKVDLLLTNGGYGSIQIALAHGVPVVAIGKTEEKPEIANRVAWAGVGVGLKVRRPSEHQIRKTVRKVLGTPAYRARARAIASEMADLDAPRISADLLEKLAESRAAFT